MSKRVRCWIPLCLLSLAACSMVDRVPQPVTETKVVPQQPADGLLALCEAPSYVPTMLVRDMQDNWISADAAYNACAARMRCLVWWIRTANHAAPPKECDQQRAAR